MTVMAQGTEREKIAHLLRRFGLGASESEIEYYGKSGLEGAIDRLLDFESVPEGLDVPLSAFAAPNNGNVNMRAVQAWWILRLLTTRRPLLEKMVLFWHDHFATSASKVQAPPMMYQQNAVFRENATGRFQTLLLEASQDPAMLFWLDNQYNVRGKPNENFAREVMELFTLGIGHYSERDIQEAARAFTGWSIRRTRAQDAPLGTARFEYQFRRNLFDPDVKEILENKGPFTGEDVIGILCGQPQTAIYLTTKLWEWFAYPNPEPALVERLAKRFGSSGLDIKKLLRDIMESPQFYSAKAIRAIYKNPVDFAVSTLRQLGYGEIVVQAARGNEDNVRRFIGPVGALQQGMASMGMDLLFPPDVAGWEHGEAWITTATMVERISWADRIFGVAAPATGGRNRAQVRYPAYPLLADDPTPEGVVKKLVSIFDAPITENKLPQLVAAARKAAGGAITRQNANQVAAAVSRLIFAAPEFQMA